MLSTAMVVLKGRGPSLMQRVNESSLYESRLAANP
ncbi:hypothetical protein Q31a_32660 [Aureliella helgolandensis]|uniref:Uncharacterized protein n=1 Tax=Aureliella helgolandensis TaxID=2527968 RepID=A0A518G8M5_9BACT|nr:hypothetical protein Q31a_32660 [Aureliella helgolandensis]